MELIILYSNDPKFLDRQVVSNRVDPDQTADQGLHCLPFRQHYLVTFLSLNPHCSIFRMITIIFSGVQIFTELYFSDDINLCKHLLSSLLSMTQRLRSSMHLLRDLAQDIHSQLGDIDQVGFYPRSCKYWNT